MVDSTRISRLRWLCRRGMKELDVLLEAFLQNHQAELENGSFPELEEFLASEDDLLWDTLQGRSVPPDPGWAALADLIRRDS